MRRKGGNLRWWLATVAMGLGVVLGLALGMWQLERAGQKQRWQQALQVQQNAAVLEAAAVREKLAGGPAALQAWWHRPIALQGQWMPEHTVYLDNRQMQGRPGFYVLTPLQLSPGEVVLVQRGWVARNFQQRQVLLEVDTPSGQVSVQGRLAGPPGRLFALGEGDLPDAQNPRIRQNLDLSAFAQSTGLALWPVTVVQTGAPSEGLLRAWPQPDSGIATHYGYALQWFAIAAVLAGMLLWFQILRPLRAARQRHAHPKS